MASSCWWASASSSALRSTRHRRANAAAAASARAAEDQPGHPLVPAVRPSRTPRPPGRSRRPPRSSSRSGSRRSTGRLRTPRRRRSPRPRRGRGRAPARPAWLSGSELATTAPVGVEDVGLAAGDVDELGQGLAEEGEEELGREAGDQDAAPELGLDRLRERLRAFAARAEIDEVGEGDRLGAVEHGLDVARSRPQLLANAGRGAGRERDQLALVVEQRLEDAVVFARVLASASRSRPFRCRSGGGAAAAARASWSWPRTGRWSAPRSPAGAW